MNRESSTFPAPMATSSQEDDRAHVESSTESPNEGDEAKASEPKEKASAEAKGAKGSASAKAGRGPAKRGSKPARPKASGGVAQGAPVPVRKQGGSLGKSVVLFVVIVGGLAAAFAVFNTGDGGGRTVPSWKTGQQVDVELTLVKTDKEDLACASSEELGGRHCAFESQSKRWSKDDSSDDKKLLKPYTTTNGAELLAAGLWSEPALSGTLPATRFSVKCKYTVEGKLKKPGIRWAADRPWYDNGGDWYSGAVTGCTLIP